MGKAGGAAAAVLMALAMGRTAAAQGAPAPGELLADAGLYTEQEIGGGFASFISRYTPSVDLEATVWELTSNSDTLARLADLFGWSDPWEYRNAVRAKTNRDQR